MQQQHINSHTAILF